MFSKKTLFILVGALALLAVLAVFLVGRNERHVLDDRNVMQAVQERMTRPGRLCLPTYIEFGQAEPLPTDEKSAREVADLSALGLAQADAEQTTSGQLVLRVTTKGQPFVDGGKLCLAQYRYGQLRGTADRRVDEGGRAILIAKIEPIIEPLPGVNPDWLKSIHSIVSIRGMDAELVDTAQGWKANSVSLY
ncbi:hypothetical protein [Deinococcus humi]|uniref:Uncharacterized protein n=1 Tax=Deinococcus humi TaxID=662880 RepID=A0A7W8JYQ5_9DEIO|nr:hypothetical protein [Deinococcus humi]MBB5365692.1 hypothetical protein [Deinococcus humi]